MLIGQACPAASPKLPATAPVPTGSPAAPPETGPPDTGKLNPQSPPLPTPRPDLPASTDVKPEETAPHTVLPEAVAPPIAQPKAASPAPQSVAKPEPVDVHEERLCRDDLRTLGVDFEPHDALADAAAGCFMANPVTLKSLGKAIKLAPEAVLNCTMARATARFMQDVVSPAAKADLGSELTSINHASAYVCRPRHGAQKLSEHAFGNAIDIASFGLADGRRIEVKAGAQEKIAKFLDAIRRAACGPFKTVLGPGSDPDHALHFHFDLARRRTGSTFCE